MSEALQVIKDIANYGIAAFLVYWLTQNLDHKLDKIIKLLEGLQ